MKKLALVMLLAVAAPLFAVISDAEYAQEVQELKSGVVDLLALLMGQETALQTSKAFDDNYALYEFALKGNLPAVQYLVEIKKVNPNPYPGLSPLGAAVQRGHNDVIKYLLDHGVYMNDDLKLIIVDHANHPVYQESLNILKPYLKSKL